MSGRQHTETLGGYASPNILALRQRAARVSGRRPPAMARQPQFRGRKHERR